MCNYCEVTSIKLGFGPELMLALYEYGTNIIKVGGSSMVTFSQLATSLEK